MAETGGADEPRLRRRLGVVDATAVGLGAMIGAGVFVTLSGAASSLTIASPKPWTNATGWYAYVTQADGASFTRQQAAGSPTPLRTDLALTAAPTSTGAVPPVAGTSASAPFTAADVGKCIVVPSAGGFLNVPLITTIASWQSASQVTLASPASRLPCWSPHLPCCPSSRKRDRKSVV